MRRLERRLRLASGLVIASFVIGHLFNHVLAIASLQLAETVRAALAVVWHQPLMVLLLYGAFLVHIGAAFTALYRRRTLRMPAWEVTQVGLGLLVVPLLAVHVAGTRGIYEVLDVPPDYARTLLAIWGLEGSSGFIRQVLLTLVVWVHLCYGLHFWLRIRPWYPRLQPLLYALALLLPALAITGLLRGGDEVRERAADAAWLERLQASAGTPLPDIVAFVYGAETVIVQVFLALLAGVAAARLLRGWFDRHRRSVTLRLGDGRLVTTSPGRSVLESLRSAGIAHASVCGGRGRCTTCRIRIGSGAEHLDLPSALEREALARIDAPPNVRLACQTRPRQSLHLSALLPASAGLREARRPGGVSGREAVVTTLFLDLRGSTRLGERKLPYDVLFILNQFFADMAAALASTRGHYAQFAGDGLMALYGLRGDVERGARDALDGAELMLERLAALNERLGDELDAPLRVGIGIHTGEAIVGTMGPPQSPNHTAIGDNINIAARLEAKSKEFGCSVVVSAATLHAAGVDTAGLDLLRVDVRGRDGELDVCAVADEQALRALRTSPREALERALAGA